MFPSFNILVFPRHTFRDAQIMKRIFFPDQIQAKEKFSPHNAMHLALWFQQSSGKMQFNMVILVFVCGEPSLYWIAIQRQSKEIHC